MQFLIVLSAALALASATPGYLGAGVLGGHGVVAGLGYAGHGYVAGPAYHGPLASNVLTPTGHTVEVAAATANHLNAVANVRATNGIVGLGAHGVVGVGALGVAGLHGGYASNVLTPTGHTVEVAAATANHLNAVANVRATNGIVGLGAHGVVGVGALGVAGHHGGYASGILTPSGDTIEVAAAKANHFQAHANARAANGIVGLGAHGIAGIHGLGAHGGALGVHGVGAVGHGYGSPVWG